MTTETLSNSETFLQAFIDEDGKFKWDTNLGNQGRLRADIIIGGLSIAVYAGLNAYDEPTLTLEERTPATNIRPRFDVTIEAIDSFELEVEVNEGGYVLPVPSLEGLRAYVDDEWGYRKYIVPDEVDKDVSVAMWINEDAATGQRGYFTEGSTVSGDDNQFIRAFISKLLPISQILVEERY
jgi:hypothetical protein